MSIIGLCCRILALFKGSFAKETYNGYIYEVCIYVYTTHGHKKCLFDVCIYTYRYVLYVYVHADNMYMKCEHIHTYGNSWCAYEKKKICVLRHMDTNTYAYIHRRSQIWGGILHRCLTRHTARLTTHQSQAAYSYICIHMYIYTYTCIYMYYMYRYIYAVYIYI